jgi:hypothetical protein
MRNFYREGDFLVRCQRSGQKALRGDCVKQWDGLIVIKEYAEQRHPLDMQRAVPAERAPRETVPDGPLVFLDPGDVTPDML